MKRLLFIAVLSISTCVYSQNIAFEQALPLPPEPQITSNLIRVINGCSDFADVDGDNDQDLFITGEGEPINNSFYSHSQMYLNDGAGNFLAVVSPFDSVAFGSVAFADVDGDNDNDLLITGHYYYTTPFSTSLHKVAKLYANDGSGNFVEVTGTPFEPISFSSIDFADIDGDNDLDLLISGENLSNTNIIKLYVNDGLGNFTEVIGTPFSQYGGGKVSFSDIDGDNDQDLLLFNAGKLYTNDGLGNFTEVIGTPFLPITGGDLAFGDIDGDSDQDLLTTGTASWASVKLYTNDGLGNFTEVIGTNWAVPTPMGGSRIAFSDIDGDNDLDFVITHCAVPSGGSATVLYINDGLGNFTAVSPSPFNNQYSDYLNFCDINSDGDKDLLILGDGSWGSAKLYENDGNGIFREAVGSPFVGLYKSTIAFADIDNDNDIDVAISGTQVTGEQETKLYRNDGLGNFTEIIGTNLISGQHPYVAFSDVDSDNDQDLLILGMANWNWFLTRVYLNDGLGNFSPPFQSALVGGNGTGSQLLLGDIDNDGDEDLLINDILYSNDGLGAFTMVA